MSSGSTDVRPGYDSFVPQWTTPAHLKPRFKAYTSKSVAAVTNTEITACIRTACECTFIDSLKRVTYSNFETKPIIWDRPPAIADNDDSGTVWVAYNSGRRAGGVWLRCGLNWILCGVIRPVLKNAVRPVMTARWDVYGSNSGYGFRTNATLAFNGFPGVGRGNNREVNKNSLAFECKFNDITTCNSYHTGLEPGTLIDWPGYESEGVMNTNSQGDLNGGTVKNRGNAYNGGSVFGTSSLGTHPDSISLGLVNVPIVIPTLPKPDGTVPGFYKSIVRYPNGVPKTDARGKVEISVDGTEIPYQNANYLQHNPYISRFVQYKINIPNRKEVPTSLVRFLWMNSQIVPFIQPNSAYRETDGSNSYNKPYRATQKSFYLQQTGPNGNLTSKTDTLYFSYVTDDYKQTTPTHLSMELSPDGGKAYLGQQSPVAGGVMPTRQIFVDDNEENSSVNLSTACTSTKCAASLYKDGDIIVQYYCHIRGKPGLSFDADTSQGHANLFNTDNIAGFSADPSDPQISWAGKWPSYGTRLAPNGEYSGNWTAAIGTNCYSECCLLHFRKVSGNTWQYMKGYKIELNSNYTAARHLLNYSAAYAMQKEFPGVTYADIPSPFGFSGTAAPGERNYDANWKAVTTNAIPGQKPPELLFNCYNPGCTNYSNYPGQAGSVFPEGSAASSSYGLEPDRTKDVREWMSVAAHHSINNFGVTYNNSLAYANAAAEQMGKGVNGMTLQVLSPGQQLYVPINTLKRVFDIGVFNTTRISDADQNINYADPTPYRGKSGAEPFKSLKEWLIDELMDVQVQEQLPLTAVDPSLPGPSP